MKTGTSAAKKPKQMQKKPVHSSSRMLGRSDGRSADAHERQANAAAERIVGLLTPSRRSAAAVPLSTNSGAPLPSGLRNFFEDQFGHDLGLVRIHAGPGAAAAATLFPADAYTIGHDISFAE